MKFGIEVPVHARTKQDQIQIQVPGADTEIDVRLVEDETGDFRRTTLSIAEADVLLACLQMAIAAARYNAAQV